MSYIDDNLMPGEQVIHRAQLHWAIFVFPGIGLFIGLIIAIAVGAAVGGVGGAVTAMIILAVSAIPIIATVTRYLTTEFAITSRRVIAKRGWINRRTLELNHSRIEGLTVNQGPIARILNTGTIVVTGTGGSRQPLPSIRDPMGFRRQTLETIDKGH